jgi:hypothetical protein
MKGFYFGIVFVLFMSILVKNRLFNCKPFNFVLLRASYINGLCQQTRLVAGLSGKSKGVQIILVGSRD